MWPHCPMWPMWLHIHTYLINAAMRLAHQHEIGERSALCNIAETQKRRYPMGAHVCPTWLQMSRLDTKWTIWPHVAPCGSIYTHLHIYRYRYTYLQTAHYPMVPRGNVTQTQSYTPEISNATESTLENTCGIAPVSINIHCALSRPQSSPFGRAQQKCGYAICPLAFPIRPRGAHNISDNSALHGHSNHTERVKHNIGDSSALRRRSRSYREGPQHWR